MSSLFYTKQQLKVFTEDLLRAFLKSGFEIVEEPYIDYALCGFRATYVRRYLLQQPTRFCDGIMTTLIHVVGLPFGCQSQKMVIMSTPRSVKNETIAETLKLRMHFDEAGQAHVVHNDHSQPTSTTTTATATATATTTRTTAINLNSHNLFQVNFASEETISNQSNQQRQFLDELASYVSQIIETISPGLIQLPTEMKLEILKQLSVDSIIKMSQVNNEFKALIFQHGESLWRHLCLRDFNIKSINRRVHKSWMELYRDSYIMHQIEVCRKERALPGLPERPALPPAPYRLQIGWLPQVLELPLYPLHEEAVAHQDNLLPIALGMHRADSLDSLL